MTTVIPSPPPGSGRSDAYRWNWDSPVIFSSADPKVAYMGANLLFKSTDRGGSWKAISPDLTTRTDRDMLKLMGAVVPANALSRHDGVTAFPSITSIGESPLDAQVLYTGTDDGQVQVSRNGGKNWTNVTANIAGLPHYTYVSTVLPSRYAAGRVYATFDGHYNDDYNPYVYVSEDFGGHWRSIAAGLPETSVNRIREHPHDAHFLVLAHERGVHFSNDGGATWNSLATNMPTTPTDDAIIHPRDNALIVGTHGRGIWILDDIGPLEALTADGVKSDAVLSARCRSRANSARIRRRRANGHGEFFAAQSGVRRKHHVLSALSGIGIGAPRGRRREWYCFAHTAGPRRARAQSCDMGSSHDAARRRKRDALGWRRRWTGRRRRRTARAAGHVPCDRENSRRRPRSAR